MKFRRTVTIKRPTHTRLTFSADDLSALAKLLAAGQVIVPTTAPVLARLKAAMTRLGVPAPKGL